MAVGEIETARVCIRARENSNVKTQILIPGVALVLTACVVPDVSAFKAASHDIYGTTEQIAGVFERDVGQIKFEGSHTIEWPVGSGTKISGDLETLFARVWQPHVEATLAMAAYSDALAELAASPENTAQRINKLATSVSSVFSAAGGHAFSGGVNNALQAITQSVAKWRASAAMHTAVTQLDPHIQLFAQHLSSSFGAAHTFIDNMHDHLKTIELGDTDWKPKIDRIAAHRRTILRYRKSRPGTVNSDAAAQISLAFAELEALQAERRANEFQRARRGLRKLLELVAATQATIREWRSEHARIGRALSDDRTLSAPRLLQKASALRGLYYDVRSSLKEK